MKMQEIYQYNFILKLFNFVSRYRSNVKVNIILIFIVLLICYDNYYNYNYRFIIIWGK